MDVLAVIGDTLEAVAVARAIPCAGAVLLDDRIGGCGAVARSG